MTGSIRSATATSRHVPGEPGIWVLILGDMAVFGLFFASYVYYRAQNPALYAASQALLNRNYATMGTLLLLTSSLLVVCGVHWLRTGVARRAPSCFAGGFALGACFVALKALEYHEKFDAGIGLATNSFFVFYFMLTGIHLAHVLVGLVLLGFVWRRARQMRQQRGSMVLVEGGASYWHMVDLLWIVLFPLLYLMRAA